MTDHEFRDWLRSEVLGGRMTSQQHDDLLEQKQYFDAHRTEIETQFQQQVVGYVSGKRETSPTAHELLALVQQTYPGRMVYFEPVGFELAAVINDTTPCSRDAESSERSARPA